MRTLSVLAVPLAEVPVAGKSPVGTSAGSRLVDRPLHAADWPLLSEGTAGRGAATVGRRAPAADLGRAVAAPVLRRGTEPANTAGAGCVAAGAVAAVVAGRRVRAAGRRLRFVPVLTAGRFAGCRAAGFLAGAAVAGALVAGAGAAVPAGAAAGASAGAAAGASAGAGSALGWGWVTGAATVICAGDERRALPDSSVPNAATTYEPAVAGAVNPTTKPPDDGIVTVARVAPPSTLIENESPGVKFTPVNVPLSPGAYTD